MLPFRHDRLQKLELLLELSSAVLRKYNSSDLDLPAALTGFLDQAIAVHHDLGLATGENALLALKAQYVSAQHGTNPLSLERVTSHRRGLERVIGLSVLQQGAQQLRDDIGENQQSLAETNSLLAAIVLNALQRGLIPGNLPVEPNQQQLNDLWTTLARDLELQGAARRVTVSANTIDIILLLGDLIKAARISES